MAKKTTDKTTKRAAVESFTRRMEGTKEQEVSEEIEILEFETEPAVVTVEYGLTLNLGNYESARVAYGVRVPCYAEEVNEASEWAQKWVSEKVEAEAAKIRS